MQALIFLLAVLATTSKLLYVVELARHGARYPINPFYDYLATIGDAGELTSVGMRQHYNLGRYLRRDYIEKEQFLSNLYDHSQITVFSTQYKRTIESAFAQMSGLYANSTGPIIPIGVKPQYLKPPFAEVVNQGSPDYALPGGQQPVPVLNGEIYLQNCDNYQYWQDLMISENIRYYGNVTLYYAAFIDHVRKLFNLTDKESNLVGLSKLYDTLICDRYLKRVVPLSDTQMNNLRHLHYYLYMLIHSGTYSKIISTPLFRKIIFDLDNRLTNTQSNAKMTVFLGHDTNISPTLSFLNMSSFNCIEDIWQNKPLGRYLNCEDGPGFASNLIVELRDDNDQQGPYVSAFYNGKEMNLCERYQKKCSYEQWRRRVVNSFVDFEKLCLLKEQTLF